MEKPTAVIIIGPTGSGKTPLGEFIATRGVPKALAPMLKCTAGTPCAHFDFGEELRRTASGQGAGLYEQDMKLIRDLLERGALLEGDSIQIAGNILRKFVACHQGRVIVLNGFPRHVGQTATAAEMCDVRLVIQLECPIETSLRRISTNAGGDRTGRNDDAAGFVRRRREIFERHTSPLVEHYQSAGVAIAGAAVGEQTKPDELLRSLVIQGTTT